jgi:hypothetical protein
MEKTTKTLDQQFGVRISSPMDQIYRYQTHLAGKWNPRPNSSTATTCKGSETKQNHTNQMKDSNKQNKQRVDPTHGQIRRREQRLHPQAAPPRKSCVVGRHRKSHLASRHRKSRLAGHLVSPSFAEREGEEDGKWKMKRQME